MDRRRFLAITGALSITGLSGCSGDSIDDSSGPGGPTEEPNGNPTTESSEAAYRVRISYDGEWTGTVGGVGSSRTVDGTGTETFEIDGDPFIVSANAQKQDDSSGEITVQILQDGEVIAEESTTAEYGVAQITSEDDTNSGGGEATESGPTYEVRVEYNGEWQGSISTGGSSRSVQGSTPRTVDIDGSPSVISANAQKQDDSSRELTVQIIEDGEVVKEASTTAEYGVAQISYTSF